MLVVGLTGGIGSGKSTVGKLFAERHVPVIDTDEIARLVVEPGQPALEEIRAHFGSDVIYPNGRLDRDALRKKAFTDVRGREQLEAIIHPRIRKQLRERLAQVKTPYCIVAIPLLVEKGWQSEVDRILVVDAPEQLQVRRTAARPGLDTEQVRRIMQSQASRKERLSFADDIIVNDGGLEELDRAVAQLHRRYCELSAGR